MSEKAKPSEEAPPSPPSKPVKAPFWTPRRIARIAVFIALSVVGAYIKIPSPTGTVAMDSCPGYFSALSWGYVEGVIVIALGHIATSASVGFPLGTLHLLIAVLMMIAAALLRLGQTKFPVTAGRLNLIIGVIIAATFNGLMGFFFVPFFGLGFAIAMTPSLMVASYIDVIISALAFEIVRRAGMV